MKKNLFHIIFSLLLVFAVSDYIWYELVKDESISVELETEKEKEEINEEIREQIKSSEGKHNSFGGFGFVKAGSKFVFKESFSLDQINNNISKVLQPHRLCIIHCQLRLPC